MEDVSDAGGVAARIGFQYQDHVAARFVLQMIRDRRIVKVECEVGDDITIFWKINGLLYPEYVQVKTTDKDSKWTATELLNRKVLDKPTSLAEKSLLCDRAQPNARFRIVAKRGVNKSLSILQDPIERRAEPEKIEKLAASFKRRHSKTVSDNGNDLGYWIKNTLWETYADVEHLKALNMQTIREIADDERTSLSNTQTRELYKQVLERVEAAATATRRNKDAKKVGREQILDWCKNEMEKIRADAHRSGTPYRAKSERFFVELHTLSADALGRSSSSYDAQYERKKWHSKQLAQYLSKWVIELTLRASELIEIDQFNLKEKLASSIRSIEADSDVDEHRLFGETLLHAILRHWFKSEPIACKFFHRSSFGDQVTRNAHIIHDDSGDQIWLGRAKIYSGATVDGLFEQIKSELIDSLQTDVLVAERDTILQLYEPQFLTTNNLGDALERGAPIDALISVLCLSILVAYDSTVLSSGHVEDYQSLLLAEVMNIVNSIGCSLPDELREVRFHLFLVPIENTATLLQDFSNALKAA